MTEPETRKVFFYSLTLKSETRLNCSASVSHNVIYFSTQRKMDAWRAKNPDLDKTAVFGMHEISLDCAKALIRISKKKPRCYECGK